MAKLISQTDLKEIYKKEVKELGETRIAEIIKEKRNIQSEGKKAKSVFLCHSHQDKTIVDKITIFFNRLDVNIYVDWMDNAMPKVTNGETASMIKSKIEFNNRFLFLATYYGLRSKWCDWELGLAYSIKKVTELAILPIESKSGQWRGSEYLKLYPIMVIKEDELEHANSNSVTIEKDHNIVTLEQWLSY